MNFLNTKNNWNINAQQYEVPASSFFSGEGLNFDFNFALNNLNINDNLKLNSPMPYPQPQPFFNYNDPIQFNQEWINNSIQTLCDTLIKLQTSIDNLNCNLEFTENLKNVSLYQLQIFKGFRDTYEMPSPRLSNDYTDTGSLHSFCTGFTSGSAHSEKGEGSHSSISGFELDSNICRICKKNPKETDKTICTLCFESWSLCKQKLCNIVEHLSKEFRGKEDTITDAYVIEQIKMQGLNLKEISAKIYSIECRDKDSCNTPFCTYVHPDSKSGKVERKIGNILKNTNHKKSFTEYF